MNDFLYWSWILHILYLIYDKLLSMESCWKFVCRILKFATNCKLLNIGFSVSEWVLWVKRTFSKVELVSRKQQKGCSGYIVLTDTWLWLQLRRQKINIIDPSALQQIEYLGGTFSVIAADLHILCCFVVSWIKIVDVRKISELTVFVKILNLESNTDWEHELFAKHQHCIASPEFFKFTKRRLCMAGDNVNKKLFLKDKLNKKI